MKNFKQLIAEVAQPKSEDELNFKAKHEIEMMDHPESEEHQHTAEKKGRKRLADYAKGEDMTVYESVKFNGLTFTDYKTFSSDREANKFLEKNDDYGIIGTKGGKVYAARLDDIGEDMTVYEKKMDPVDHKALKGDFEDREDKDIDNDGKVDDSDRYLHKRRQAISKAMKENMQESFSVFKPMSPAPGKSVSNRVQVKSFKTSDAMNTFLAKGANATQWKPTEKQGLKSGTYKMDMQRGNDGNPQRNFIKESADLSEDVVLDQIRNILTKKNDGTKVIKDRSGYFHIKYKDSSHKGPYHTLNDVLRGLSESAFIAKAAAAKKADKKKFELGDKKFPVTIKKDTADKIIESNLDRYMWKDINAALMKAGVPPTTIMRVVSALKGKELKESKMEDSEVLSAAKALAKNGKDAKTKSFGQGLVDYYDENGSFTPAQVGGLQNIMKNASFQLAKESVELSENFKQGSVSLNDGSKVVVSKQNADLLNQMFDDLNPKNKKEMMAVAMKDKGGFNEILDFAREAL